MVGAQLLFVLLPEKEEERQCCVKERQTTALFLRTSRLFQGLKIWLQRVPQVSWWRREGDFLTAVETEATEKGGLGGYVYCDHPGVSPANLEASVLANNCWPQGPDLTVEPSGGY